MDLPPQRMLYIITKYNHTIKITAPDILFHFISITDIFKSLSLRVTSYTTLITIVVLHHCVPCVPVTVRSLPYTSTKTYQGKHQYTSSLSEETEAQQGDTTHIRSQTPAKLIPFHWLENLPTRTSLSQRVTFQITSSLRWGGKTLSKLYRAVTVAVHGPTTPLPADRTYYLT